MENPIKIFASAGEVSGERILAQILKELNTSLPSLEIRGLGGTECLEQGLEPLESLHNIAINGVWEVFIRSLFFCGLWIKIRKAIRDFKPELVILVDYPGFNKKILSFCKQKGYAVYYVAPPQVWPYRTVFRSQKTRIFKDVPVQVLFDMEVARYQLAGAGVSVGHFFKLPRTFRENLEYLCLCPGSRFPTIRRNLPTMLTLAEKCSASGKKIALLVPREFAKCTLEFCGKLRVPSFELFTEKEEVLGKTIVAIAHPGTITLELALWNIPLVVVGLVDPLTYIMGKILLDTHWVSLPNALIGKGIFPEVISWRKKRVTARFETVWRSLGEKKVPRQQLAEKLGEARGPEIAREKCLALLLRDSRITPFRDKI